MDHRIIYNSKTGDETSIPVMPLIVGMEGIVGEARSIKGAAAIVIGNHYYDSPDVNMDWNLRVEAARKECMKALGRGIEAAVYDSRHGIIKDNFAAADDDQDYVVDEDGVEWIRVEDDKVFLLSLVRIGAIRLLERDDSFFFRPGQQCCILEYSGGSYVDILQEYDINELIGK